MLRALLFSLSLLVAPVASAQTFTGYFPGKGGGSSSGGGGGGVTALGTPSGSQANGGSITGSTLTLSLADVTNPGLLVAADKTKLNNTSGTNSGDLTIGSYSATSTANGGVLTGQSLSLRGADSTNPGLQAAANYQKTNGLTPPRLIVPPDYSNANTATSWTAGRVILNIVYVPLRATYGNIQLWVPQAGTLSTGSVTVGLYGPITGTGASITCAGATLLASSASTAVSAGNGAVVGSGWPVPFTTPATIEPGHYCLAVAGDTAGSTAILLSRSSNFRGLEDSWHVRFTTDPAYGTLPGTVPAVTTMGSDIPVSALKF